MIIGQPHVIKEYNTDLIKNLIAERGPVTKPMLSEATRLSLPTVNKIVGELERSGIVRECRGERESAAAGRPAKTYMLNENAGSVAVVYYLNGMLVTSLRDFSGRETERRSFAAQTDSRESSLESLKEAITCFGSEGGKLKAAGVGLPGVVKADGAVTGIPRMPRLDGCRVALELTELCGLPVYVENDVKLMTVGYYGSKLEGRCTDMVLVYVGRGLGSGIIINKRLHKGASCFAGEYGYMALTGEDMRAGLERRMTELTETFAEKGFSGSEREEYCELLARVAANFVCTLNPEVIAFRGEWTDERAIKEISARMGEYIPQDDMPELIAVESDEYGLLGAYRLCMGNLSVKMKLVQQQGV